jgi:acetyl-CoA carboxylase biotin carboxyl carrier protein
MGSSMIDISYLKELLEIFDASSVHDLRIEQEGVEIRLSKSPRREEGSQTQTFSYGPMTMSPQQPATAAAPTAATPATPETAPAEPEATKKVHEIRSPIVGTFYRAPNPDSPPFAEVGQTVSPGMVLCIVEAMKLMNEIECDAFGKVAKVLVENAQPVEYNQLLFLIEQE